MAEEDRTALKSLNTIAINLLYTDRVEDNAYSLYDLHGHTQAQEAQTNNVGKPLHGHHNYILIFSYPYLGVEEKLFKEIMHFHNMTCGHALVQETLPWG